MKSKADVVIAIRTEIRANQLVPGQRLIESELCERFDTSRAAVRGALMDLTTEGLVERVANRGARVRVVGLEEALHISEARMVIECLCAARAAQKMTDADIALMQDLCGRLPECLLREDVITFVELTAQMRDLYLTASAQPVGREVIYRLRDQMIGHRFRLTFRPGRARETLPFWQELTAALAARDAAAAEDAVRRHTRNVQASMRRLSQWDLGPFAPMPYTVET